ncbi:Hypothetical predicted protein [Olea europaea subsp. europaea]|uniref:Uncharacterized protein n=1 Tax=Olea europaea subsp. europaea TaxID=158383 RepID=A0A8S0QE39_OLEEU|nr:Hypothetical predicted protein [Olea europaea subsp. europaea]
MVKQKKVRPNPYDICNKNPRLTNRRQSTVFPPPGRCCVICEGRREAVLKQLLIAVDGRMATTTSHRR